MRSKSIARRDSSPPTRSGRGVLVGVALLLAGAAAALTIEHMPSGAPLPTPSIRTVPTATTGPTAALVPTAALEPAETPVDTATQELPSPSLNPTPGPASAILESQLPTQIGGVPLTITSAAGASVLGNTPAARALSAAAVKLGKAATALELGYAYDPSGDISANVLAFRIDGVAAAILEPVILHDWLSAGAPGVIVSSDTLSGVVVRHVSYGDEGPDEWVVSHGDAVFIIETSDKAIVISTIASLRPAAAPSSGSPLPSVAAASSSPLASASP